MCDALYSIISEQVTDSVMWYHGDASDAVWLSPDSSDAVWLSPDSSVTLYCDALERASRQLRSDQSDNEYLPF